MIVLKLELWRGGNEKDKIELGRTFITNTGGTQDLGDYEVRVCRRGMSKYEGPHTRTGNVSQYPRLKFNVWRLVIRALKDCFPEEK
jgi:hypothetical protein